MNQRQHAPVFQFFREALGGYRGAGLCDHRLGLVLDEYLGHLARSISGGEMTVAEGLVLGNRVVRFASHVVPLDEARHVPRDRPAPPPAPSRPFPWRENTLVRDAEGRDGSWRKPGEPVARARCPTCTGT
ncbi:hypothetical protein [Methylobacterium gnaphalii]|uniref:Uncharacterized protein n=1 Tax=Methylobacterium gnaphalii TaxID=1010610 RepID=A0A512JG18_9HYPH|nr:hypothetical protein [Methylobacterium gnaphalii]GEP08900.1 hypothetical protein MGN01_07450 [Methylobacterium gnaphalii]GJD70666.1 hypothetical protein MMMDOFMJ_3618 [Methylobacterium gnaphalii]GLS50454.1 hypothetical protein GCM10007885_33060 [Methylobacterium gnaphalii]